jgi:hypothetical protein
MFANIACGFHAGDEVSMQARRLAKIELPLVLIQLKDKGFDVEMSCP